MPADPPLLRSRASSIRAARSSPRIRWQLDRSIVLADAVQVGWVGELTRRNAAAIGELVAVYTRATHDLLQ